MRRISLIAAVLMGASVLAACQSQGVASPTPQTVIGTITTPTVPTVPAFSLKGNATKGKTLFTANCTGCHTLADANASGTVGPNLDDLKPDYQRVTAQVTNGGGVMPAYGKDGTFTDQQVADVSAYVVTATGGTVP
jgi:mono/diheme cytochrome c family protein